MQVNSEVAQKITGCRYLFVRVIVVVFIFSILPSAFSAFAENAGNASSESDIFDADAIPLVDKKLLMSYLADHSKLLLIDARSKSEFDESHIEGAINLPIEAYRVDPQQIAAHKSSKIVIYCRSGKRASRLAAVLKKEGFSDVEVLPSRQIISKNNLMVFNCGVDTNNK